MITAFLGKWIRWVSSNFRISSRKVSFTDPTMRTGAQSAQLSVIAKSSLRHRLGCPLSKNNQDSSRTDESVHGSFPRRFLLVKSVRRVIVCSSFYFLTRWLLRLKNHHFAILKRPISVIIAGIRQRTRNANSALPVDDRCTGKLAAWYPTARNYPLTMRPG